MPASPLSGVPRVLYRRDWRTHLPIYLLFLSFVAVTAVFWAHSSHRSHLDVYLIVFASAGIRRIAAWEGIKPGGWLLLRALESASVRVRYTAAAGFPYPITTN